MLLLILTFFPNLPVMIYFSESSNRCSCIPLDFIVVFSGRDRMKWAYSISPGITAHEMMFKIIGLDEMDHFGINCREKQEEN